MSGIQRIGIMTSKNTWTIPYCDKLKDALRQKGYFVSLGFKPDELQEPLDVVCILSYSRILPGEFLRKHKHNLVAHASPLPKGRGWSPLNWQILEGRNEIPVTLFEAQESLDSGKIYIQEILKFKGHELLPEMLHTLGETINSALIRFLDEYDKIATSAKEQEGEPTFYEKRLPSHSELSVDKSIAEQFNLLRVVDNERYPAFFHYKGHKYILKIFKAPDESKP